MRGPRQPLDRAGPGPENRRPMATEPFHRALVTGASSGIGRALAVELGRRGAHVHLVARRAAALEETLSAVRAAGGEGVVLAGDVTDAPWLEDALARADERHGLDLVIAGAGVAENSMDDPRRAVRTAAVFELNLLAAARTLEAALPPMRARGRGTLCGISSLAGYRGMGTAAAYCASKAGLSAWLEGLRADLHGSGVRVCDVRPGFVRTPMTSRNRFPMPFLMEPEAAARRTVDGLERGRPVVEYPRRLAWPLRLAARTLPRGAWRRLTQP